MQEHLGAFNLIIQEKVTSRLLCEGWLLHEFNHLLY
jgi:hypothetical protein